MVTIRISTRPFLLITSSSPRPPATTTTATVRQVRKPLLTSLSEDEAVLDAAGAAQDVRVVGGGVPLAGDVGAAELELGRQGRDARPLDVLGVVAAALVRAPHHVDLVQRAYARRGHAPQLGGGGDPAVGRLGAAAAEGEGLHGGKEDGVFRLGLGLGGAGGAGEEEEGGGGEEEGGGGGEMHRDVFGRSVIKLDI